MDDKERLKNRAACKRKFTRKVNLFKEAYKREDPSQVLKEMYDHVCKEFKEIEQINEEIINSIDSNSYDYSKMIEEVECYTVDVERVKNEVHSLILKVQEKETFVKEMPKLRMQRLTPPQFDGKIREYPTFKSDYERLMKPVYGDDPYVLRSCLSGEPLDLIHGVNNSYNAMICRLDERYGNPAKVVEIVLNDIKNLKIVPENNSRKFIEMVDTIERAYLDLIKLNLSSEMNTVTMVSNIEKLLPTTQKREWVKLMQGITDKELVFSELLKYLIKEKQAFEYLEADVRVVEDGNRGQIHSICQEEYNTVTIALNKVQDKQDKLEECITNLTKVISTMAESTHCSGNPKTRPKNFNNCWYHGTNIHNIAECVSFQKLGSKERMDAVRKIGACYKCLKVGHLGRQCMSKSLCIECGKDHHQLLHSGFSSQAQISSNFLSQDGVLLMISTVYSNTHPITTLWDAGSNVTLITNRKAKQLGLKGKSINLTITRVGNDCNKFETMKYEVPLYDLTGQLHMITACGISEITSGTGKVDTSAVAKLMNVEAEDIVRPHGNIDMLIGSDYCNILPSVVKTVGNLQLLQGPFGYCIRGSHPMLKVRPMDNANICVRVYHAASVISANEFYIEPQTNISKRLNDFFSVEHLGTQCNPRCGNCRCGKCPLGSNKYSIKEERELTLISQGLIHDKDSKRWTARYPWIKTPKDLPNNFTAACIRLCATEKRLAKRGLDYIRMYNHQIQDMVARGVAKRLTPQEMANYKGPVHYLPHHEVLKPESKSTPMRIVFNSSASYMGHVLNDYYAKGPDVLNDLIGILLRFRSGPVAMIGDISKMYNSILITELDQMTHRFLWRDMNVEKEPNHYCLQTVTFGDRPSGVISMLALHKTAEMYADEYPETAAMIVEDSYVDDIIHSCETITDARDKIVKTNKILNMGGFKIKDWVISGDHIISENINVANAEIEKVLGMIWEPKKDQFAFQVKINFSKKYKNVHTGPNLTVNEIKQNAPKHLTKRLILSQIASLYDPLGLIIPFTVQCKLMMRQLITAHTENDGTERPLDWDDPISEKMYKQWMCLFIDMYALKDIKFKRCVKPDGAIGNPTLVIFADASNAAYAACAYVRFRLKNGTYSSQLLVAKNRIAPIRQITVPRLELCASLLSARLRKMIVKENCFSFERVIHLTDSMIVRAQIQKESHGFGTFVATKVAEIQTLTDPNEWWWVASENNAADLATRPQHPYNIGVNSIWQNGPAFLMLPIEQWPISRPSVSELPDRCGTFLNCNIGTSESDYLSVINIERFSSFKKLIEVTSMVLVSCKQRSFKGILNQISHSELEDAENHWIRVAQTELAENWEKRFERLGPSKNEEGVIVVGERISNWIKDNWNQEKFILLPRNHLFTRLYIQHLHNIDHGGIELTLAKLQSKFWVPGARKIIKSVKGNCVICKKIDKKIIEQEMGQLPEERLKPAPAFYNTAVDLFGPLMIRDTVKRRTKAKIYGVIFTCMTSRAVHLDLTEGYDTTNFLSTFRRFVTLRGYPHKIHSDLGTQLTAANKEIREMTKKWNTDEIIKFGLHQGLTWSFNKSADAPWQNGVCESLIKSVKRLLVITIGSHVLSFGELQTVFFEVANLLNERPIGIKPGYDLNSGSYLCPNDLLLGRASNRVPSGPMVDTVDVRKRFNAIQGIVTSFWKRWMRDYFPTLTIRQKWHTCKRNLKQGDIVLVQDVDQIRGNWKLAQVHQTQPSKDGKVRDVVLRYKLISGSPTYEGKKDKLVKRSVHRLVVILPIEDQDL